MFAKYMKCKLNSLLMILKFQTYITLFSVYISQAGKYYQLWKVALEIPKFFVLLRLSRSFSGTALQKKNWGN